MDTKLNPYLSFKDNTRAAMEFYHSVFGGKLTMGTFNEFQASQSPDEDDLIMHAELAAENGIIFMASDTPARMELKPGNNFSMSLTGDNLAEISAYFEKLSAEGTITQPLQQAIWGDTFGMCVDKFGIAWIVNISAPKV